MMGNDQENVVKQWEYRMKSFWQWEMGPAILQLAAIAWMNINTRAHFTNMDQLYSQRG